jgi:alkanesulfonate monooxygenase SsuD/methylene tetrahydromethanopterin reductase-like flavin-dependent oxidoreductase (luciferase family)
MQIGVVYPQTELRGDPTAVRRTGRAVEDLVARQAADVDLLSGAQLRLGLGVGWNQVECEALGQGFGTRGFRQEEQIELLRRFFTEPVVDFSGRFGRVDLAALLPKPARPVPMWLGGSGEVAFNRAARLGDGFMFFGGGIDHAVDARNGCALAYAASAGRRRLRRGLRGTASGRYRRSHGRDG